jgi:hypothetical protein
MATNITAEAMLTDLAVALNVGAPTTGESINAWATRVGTNKEARQALNQAGGRATAGDREGARQFIIAAQLLGVLAS